MEQAIVLEEVSFQYATREEATLKEVNLVIHAGEFLLLTGSTGCGKSTLLKLLNGMIPHASSGCLTGRVLINGKDTREQSISALAAQVGLVFQSPDEQIFSTVVEDEVAFGPENLAVPPTVIGARVMEALTAVGMASFREAKTNDLSGGQKQRVTIAAVKAMQSRILVLDEPVSQLDPQGAEEVLNILAKMHRELGLTIILVEHRIHEVAHLVDRILVMDQGRIVLDRPTREALQERELFAAYGLRLPESVDIAHRLQLPVCLSVEELSDQLQGRGVKSSPTVVFAAPALTKPEILKAENLTFAYQKKGQLTLKGVSLSINQGETIALMGNNGAGKSTLLKQLIGLLKPSSGQLTILGKDSKKLTPYLLAGEVGLVLQNPDLMLFCESVEKEIDFGMKNLKWPLALRKERTAQVLQSLGLSDLKEDFPLALSRGQRLRAALAAVLALQPKLLLLDEPTTGQDKQHITEMMLQLQGYVAAGGTLFFCTHDGETALRYAERMILLHQGTVLADGPTREIFLKGDLLQKAGLKQPPSLLLSQRLGLSPAYSPEEVERWIRA